MMLRTLSVFTLILAASLAWAQHTPVRSIVGGSYTLAAGETLMGNLNAVGAVVTLARGATLDGHLTAIGGLVTIDGTVTKDVHVYGGELRLGDRARVEGAVTTNWAAFERAPDSVVMGRLDAESADAIRFGLPSMPLGAAGNYTRAAHPETTLGILARSLRLALLAALMMVLTPKALARVEEAMVTYPGRSAALGLTAALTVAIVLVLLTITLIGIPLALAGAFVLFAAVMFGWIALGHYLGTYVERALKQSWSAAMRAFMGTLVMTFILLLLLSNLSPLGALAQFVLALIALGAVVLSRFGTRTYQPSITGSRTPGVPRAGV